MDVLESFPGQTIDHHPDHASHPDGRDLPPSANT